MHKCKMVGCDHYTVMQPQNGEAREPYPGLFYCKKHCREFDGYISGLNKKVKSFDLSSVTEGLPIPPLYYNMFGFPRPGEEVLRDWT